MRALWPVAQRQVKAHGAKAKLDVEPGQLTHRDTHFQIHLIVGFKGVVGCELYGWQPGDRQVGVDFRKFGDTDTQSWQLCDAELDIVESQGNPALKAEVQIEVQIGKFLDPDFPYSDVVQGYVNAHGWPHVT